MIFISYQAKIKSDFPIEACCLWYTGEQCTDNNINFLTKSD